MGDVSVKGLESEQEAQQERNAQEKPDERGEHGGSLPEPGPEIKSPVQASIAPTPLGSEMEQEENPKGRAENEK